MNERMSKEMKPCKLLADDVKGSYIRLSLEAMCQSLQRNLRIFFRFYFKKPRNMSVQSSPSSESSDELKGQVELFVKAGKNGESYGGCPLCQRFFMILLTKAEYNKDMTLVVTTVNMAKPPLDFKKLSTRLPVLQHKGQYLSEPDEIVQYIDSHFRYPPMNYDNVAAANACRDVFSKFSFYIKDVSQSPQPLIAELSRLDSYLKGSPHRFLCRDIPDHLDCLMLPKLQHIRVAAKAFKNFDIPVHLKSLWRYLAAAYNTPAFRESCPSDQEIVHHWSSKPECSIRAKELLALYSTDGTPKYSFDYPKGVLIN